MIMGHALDRMKFGIVALMAAVMAFGLAFAAPQAIAQDASGTDVGGGAAGAAADADAAAAAADAFEGGVEAPTGEVNAAFAGGYAPMAPTEGKGMPTSYQEDALKSMTFQDQYTADGAYALGMHDYILMPVITVISLFVLFLLLYAVVKFRRGANPVASKTTHNTMIEVVWTIVPVIILVIIAVPSITLLARQYETPPEEAITIKAVGYQWYWGYEYPDHDVEVISNMLEADEALSRGEPYQLAVDNRMVVPAGVPLRIQTTAADVIHAFAVPSLWFKQDAVPGRLNERMLVIEEPGVYYGQCSELCGSRHGYMPITVEALPMEQFEAWVVEQGGSIPGSAELEDNNDPIETGDESPEAADPEEAADA
ncbi:cytochrome c oxidase subunit II [Erythrobacter sp. KY5]|uniref:cytochrome c oxidase subunit II n=1 Tax=Erythrobacter sp. KY5 TaxID=2011159 RepID=UPI000DBF2CA1|nr:cytochrome c oxidase subunit II [Erythrobacter sp. KY5]AWW74209.1 cytochrome c oxidase subunit II [Erythrobacter sp. KY5]